MEHLQGEQLGQRNLKEILPATLDTILFDLDGVLIHEGSDEAFRRTSQVLPQSLAIDPEKFHQVARLHVREIWARSPFAEFAGRSLGIAASEALCLQTYEGENQEMQAFYGWIKEYQKEVWAQVLMSFHIKDPEMVTVLRERFQEEKRIDFRVFPEVYDMLLKLKEHYTICIITNGASDLQREKIREAGLEGIFGDNIIVSAEVGFGKPHPSIFETAIEKLGTRPQATIMIGNTLATDIRGAQEAHIASIYLDRQSEKQIQGSIATLKDLSFLLPTD